MDREQLVPGQLPRSAPGSLHNNTVADAGNLLTPPRELPKKIERQIRPPKKERQIWTAVEDSFIMQQIDNGKSFMKIALLLPGRSNQTVSYRWKQLLKNARTSPPTAFPSFEAEVDWVGKSASGSAVTVDLTGGSLVYKAKKGDKQFLNDEPTPKRNRASNMSAKKAPAKRAKKSKAAASAEKADK